MNEYGQIERIAIRRPEQAFISQGEISKQWHDLNYHYEPDFDEAIVEYGRFFDILGQNGAEIIELGTFEQASLDSIYVRDSLIVTPKGLVKAGMGKAQRRLEPGENAHFLYEKIL